MGNASNLVGIAGYQQANVWGLPDTNPQHKTGLITAFETRYWGGWELVYCYASSDIRQFGLVTITPVFVTNQWRISAAEVPNTANLGQTVGVAMTSMTTGQYGWICVFGAVPVNSTSSIAANTAFGIVAAGQAGTIAAGKQVVGARIAAAATATVVKNATGNAGSKQLLLNDGDGWFPGVYLSGTGIAAATVVVDIDPSGTIATINNATTAQVNGAITGTYNNATVFYNIAFLNRPNAQGQVT